MSGNTHMTNRLDSADIAHIFALRGQGVVKKEICRRYRISNSTVSRILDKNWIDMWRKAWGDPDLLEQGILPKNTRVLMSPKVSEMAESGMNDAEIAAFAMEHREQPSLIRASLLEQVRMFDVVKSDLHDGLEQLRDKYGITTEFYNEMVDELLDELAEWKV